MFISRSKQTLQEALPSRQASPGGQVEQGTVIAQSTSALNLVRSCWTPLSSPDCGFVNQNDCPWRIGSGTGSERHSRSRSALNSASSQTNVLGRRISKLPGDKSRQAPRTYCSEQSRSPHTGG